MYFHYDMGSKIYEISLFGLKLLATTVITRFLLLMRPLVLHGAADDFVVG